MENKLIKTLEQIMDLSMEALTQAKKDAAKMRQQFRLLQFEDTNNMTRKKKLPPNVREFRQDYYQGRKNVNGKRVTVYGSTPEETAVKLDKAIYIAELETSPTQNLDPQKLLYGDWLNLWLDTYKKPKLADSSLYQVKNVIKNHVPEWLKILTLSKLTSILIQRALNEVKTDRMREYAYSVYSDSLGWACDLEYISDIMRRVPSFKSERMPGKALSLDIQEGFIKLVDSLDNVPLGKLFHFLLLCGARPGEPQNMVIADFDYINERIHIPGTKNKYSDRFIPFFSAIHELVDDWLPLIAIRPFPFTANYIDKQMNLLLPGYTPKDLRHTFATRCKECGIPTDVYKQWLGHSKKSTVAETTYTHYDNVYRIEAKKFTLNPPELVAQCVAHSDIDPQDEKTE